MNRFFPLHWSTARLDELCEKVTDGTHHSPPNTNEGAYRYVTAKNLRPWGLDLSNITYVTEEIHDEIFARCPVEFEDVLYIKDGVTTGLAVVNSLSEPFSLLSSVALFKPYRNVLDPYFLKHWLNSPETFKELTGQMSGSAIRRIVLRQLRSAVAPLPPLNEQRRIVAKIEDLSARSRAAKEALDAIPPLLERFRQSVLAAAFRGDLTKQWREQNPNVEPASVLLDRIRQERRHRWEQDYLAQQKAKGKTPEDDKWKAKYQEPKPVDTTGLPELPEGWCWVSPSQVCTEIVDCPHSTPKYTETSVFRMVRTSDFSVGRLSLEAAMVVSEEVYRERTQRLVPEPGDILFSREGTIGVACQVPESPKICLGQRMMLLRTGRSYSDELFMWVLSSPVVTAQISKGTIGTTAQRVNVGTVKELAIPLPPASEQIEILSQIRSAFSGVERVRSISLLTARKSVFLDQSILAKAFRGELVPQDPNDEPASALLERIRAERETTPSTGSCKKRKARA